jgi:hypothetical protein
MQHAHIFTLLAVDQSYPGATQLALDMLLKVDAHEELIMVLLQRQQIIPALKYVRERNIIAPAASFLKAAKATGDDGAPAPFPVAWPTAQHSVLTSSAAVFFATFKYFESLNESRIVASQSLHDVRTSSAARVSAPALLTMPYAQESCAEYVKHYSLLFL